MSIRVLLVDDQQLMRMGFRLLVDAQADMRVVGEAATGREAVELAERVRPDVVLMDVRMPELDGVQATRAIVRSGLPTRVIILTTFDLDEYVYAALRAGASGFLLKDAQPSDLLSAIRAVAVGDVVTAPSVTRRLLGTHSLRTPASVDPHLSAQSGLRELTAREVEVFMLVARGLTNASIAERLVISEATAKTHVGRILAKLELRDRVQIVILAYEAGLVTAGSPG